MSKNRVSIKNLRLVSSEVLTLKELCQFHTIPEQTGRKNGEIFTPVLHSAATSRDNGEDVANLRTSKRKQENVRLLLRVLPSWIF